MQSLDCICLSCRASRVPAGEGEAAIFVDVYPQTEIVGSGAIVLRRDGNRRFVNARRQRLRRRVVWRREGCGERKGAYGKESRTIDYQSGGQINAEGAVNADIRAMSSASSWYQVLPPIIESRKRWERGPSAEYTSAP